MVSEKNSGAYAYAILPASTAVNTQVYAQNPTVEIVAADSNKHVVRDLEAGTLYANVFAADYVGDIYVETPCSLIIKEISNGYEITVSDPTQKLDEIILAFEAPVIAVSGQTAVGSDDGRVVIASKKSGESYTVTIERQ